MSGSPCPLMAVVWWEGCPVTVSRVHNLWCYCCDSAAPLVVIITRPHKHTQQAGRQAGGGCHGHIAHTCDRSEHGAATSTASAHQEIRRLLSLRL